MHSDLVLLRELIDGSPLIGAAPGRGKPEAVIVRVEAEVGALAPSYRWWLREYGEGTLGGVEIGTVRADRWDDLTADGECADLGGLWLSEGRLTFFADQDGGERYAFVPGGAGQEHPVVRLDPLNGEEERVAESFAGFLAVWTARALGLRDGPNPSVARLWRSTPGVSLPNGVLIHGPHTLRERNETFEIGRYAPGWTLVGDDSGGSGFFMRHHGRDRSSVYRLGLGAVGGDVAEYGERVTDDLMGWVAAGCP
ncbi:SMI1/KNR4 family protein [Streptomyces sp. NPDC057638]|uniref:SMI1/KNR4 family protein n=1 Tax=Streptomyces sp. NPDC057638 TaxID=3346190 RepID=UPI0036AE8EE2